MIRLSETWLSMQGGACVVEDDFGVMVPPDVDSYDAEGRLSMYVPFVTIDGKDAIIDDDEYDGKEQVKYFHWVDDPIEKECFTDIITRA